MAKKILVLTDKKAGHENQSKAFVRALRAEAELFEIHFRSHFAKTISYFADRFFSLKLSSLFDRELPTGDYAAVVGAGSGTFYAAKVIAKKLHIPSAVILYPRGYRLSDFNCVLAPSFDRPSKANNIIEIPANLVANDDKFYEDGVKAFYERYKPSERKGIAVIIGGPNASSTMSVDWMKKELDKIFAETSNEEHWVTTSRRTPSEVEALVDKYPWDYKLIYSRDKFNPIPAFVRLASRLYVTAESTGMLSEVCTCGNGEVYALDNLKEGNHKFRRFVDGLIAGGFINGSRKIDLSKEIEMASKLLGF